MADGRSRKAPFLLRSFVFPAGKEKVRMQLSIRDLTFAYPGAEPVFEHLNLNLDTGWRLGLIGRNGRGKTTLLRLLEGRLPFQGTIGLPLETVYYPFEVADASLPVLEVLRQAASGTQEWRIVREIKLLGVREDALERPFQTLSKGEQTKALLSALFAREDAYPLIDEPTNHLDLHGRQLVAQYLRKKDGFLLVSHDRAFLNGCVDHVLALNRSDAWVMQGDYDAWQERFDRQNAWEEKHNEDLRRDIARLEESARRAAQWKACWAMWSAWANCVSRCYGIPRRRWCAWRTARCAMMAARYARESALTSAGATAWR